MLKKGITDDFCCDFYMFNKWFLYSANLCSTINSAIWNLCSVTWDLYSTICDSRSTKWNLLNQSHSHSVNQIEWNKINSQEHSSERKIYSDVNPVCEYFLVLFERSLLQRWCLRAKFSFYSCPIRQWTHAKNRDLGGSLIRCMWTSTSFLHEYN